MIEFYKVMQGGVIVAIYPSRDWALQWQENNAPGGVVLSATDEEAAAEMARLEVGVEAGSPHDEVLKAMLDRQNDERTKIR